MNATPRSYKLMEHGLLSCVVRCFAIISCSWFPWLKRKYLTFQRLLAGYLLKNLFQAFADRLELPTQIDR